MDRTTRSDNYQPWLAVKEKPAEEEPSCKDYCGEHYELDDFQDRQARRALLRSVASGAQNMDHIFAAWLALAAIFGIIVCLFAAILYVWRSIHLIHREQDLHDRLRSRRSSSSDTLTRA